MTVLEIIKEANLRADENYTNEQVQIFVKNALHKFNLIGGFLIPTIPMGAKNLDYEPQFTQKLGNADPNDPKYKEKQETIDEHNAKMKTIDDIICTQVLVVGATYLIKVNDGSLQELENEHLEWENNIMDVLSDYQDLFDPKFKTSNIVGNSYHSGKIYTSPNFKVPHSKSTPNVRYKDNNKLGIK